MKTILIEDRGSRIEDRSHELINDRELRRFSIFLTLALFLFAPPGALGQARSGPPAQQGSQAAPLPLSGRTVQTGSVTTTETAVPGTTTSVNTINPAIQVQGPYSGSASSTGRLPRIRALNLDRRFDRVD